MRDAVIVEAVRTPVGRRNGAYKDIHPVDLSAHILTVARRAHRHRPERRRRRGLGLSSSQVGEQTMNVGRNAVLAAGWPESVPGTTVDRQCGSSQQAVHFAAAGVISGQYDVAVAGGVEVMTRVPMGSSIGTDVGFPFGPKVFARYEGQHVQPGSRRRDDRRALGSVPRAGRRVLARLAREGRRRDRLRRVRQAVRRRPRHRPRGRRGRPPRRHAREARRAEDRVQGGRRHHRRQLLADLRRLRRAAHHDQREGRGARPASRSSGCTPSRSPATTR